MPGQKWELIVIVNFDCEAIEIANGLSAGSFDWSDPDEAQVVDENVDDDGDEE